jgi:hypothetical protein
MSYGKTLKFGFLGLRGKHQDRSYLQTRVDSSQVGFLNIREKSLIIYKPWVLFP